ncbi:GntR family transcriptional regulator [endosymbiont of Ridgeia piscesae]|jgi:GntR family transcriptional regulator|uniref:DNA-binding transcriptional regulator, GntR family n=1 Tax=endosymbiont of Ridgeia piscesae TaxID=54398 RepID=A0A0T5Z7C3_9GAMM|nr:GntR family transcriptional regulator [endosymbiont of Ridgeia piscesae]KRT56142.1 DNA-binding transcriptional regulator, GntR family [endosymbiont of Ridgeia piscesae]KRT58826.1 GntR family transcriptional regulator [endosymbiont of Ridgeia piscesae]
MTQPVSVFERSSAPLYHQMANVIRRRIESQEWPPGFRLPNLDELASSFDVARVTARQAISLLEKEGLIWRRQGRGTFVTEDRGERRWLNLRLDWQELVSMIDSTQMQMLITDQRQLPLHLQVEQGAAPGYRYMRRVHSKNGSPYAVIDIYLDQRIYARDPQGFETTTVLSLLDQMPDIQIRSARQVVTLGTAEMDIAEHLQIGVDAPVANLHRTVLDANNTLIYVAEVVYRGDLIKLDINLLADER